MRRITELLLRHRKITLTVFVILVILSAVLSQLTRVNYDMAEYLPNGSMTKRAVSEMSQSFGRSGMAEVMVEDLTIQQALVVKEQIEGVDGVKSVMWLDNVVDITKPLETQEAKTVEAFYKNRAALYQVTFTEEDYATSTGKALESIRALNIDRLHIAGSAEESRSMRALLASEIFTIFLVVVTFCLLILFAASSAWVEPFLYLIVLLTAIVINMGTNAYFTSISFITRSMAAVLQLAISLDYSLFLFHRYMEERDAGKDAKEAIISASVKSLNSILASALTTIAGFLALVLMNYSIGRDIGIVLAKGIAISLLTCLTLMPVLIYCLRGLIDKTRHKHWIPSFRRLGKGAMRLRWLLLLGLIVVLVPTYLAQNNNRLLYGTNSANEVEGVSNDRSAIQAEFGVNNPVVLLVPAGDVAKETALAETLMEQSAVSAVQGLVTIADPQIPRKMLPKSVVSQFQSDNYSRLVVRLNIANEGPALSDAVQGISASAEALYPGEWMAAGTATSLMDIKKSVESDGLWVQLISVLAVAVIVLLSFRSVVIPILLVALIQTAIWINMSVPYFTGTPLIYIGYLMISSLQLGATIDYAILMTNRYMEDRRTLPPKEAAISALTAAGPSVLVSTLILAGAGFAEMMISQVSSISEIGLLLGRGALLSGGMVLIVLPPLLAILDKIIKFGTLKRKGAME